MIHILLGDDHAIVRKGLKDTLQEALGQVIFGEADTGEQILDAVRRQQWDLVILDINLEDRSGLDVLGEIRAANGKTPVLVLSMYPETQFAVQAIKEGAAGYLTKRSAAAELVGAVQKVLAGGRYIGAALAEQLAAEVQRVKVKLPHETLSHRELQVLRMIAMGKTLKEIAAELSLSPKTIGTYHVSLMRRMGMKSDTEITRYALTHGLID